MNVASTARFTSLLLLVTGLAGCGSPPEPPAADTAGAAPTAALSLDELPYRSIEGMDVCAVLPGEAVASALNMPLASTERGPEGRMCSYFLSRESRYELRVDVVLETGGAFIFTRNSSEDAQDVPGLGVAAFTREVTGIHQQIWVARRDGLYYQVSAYDPDMAEPVAQVALDRIP